MDSDTPKTFRVGRFWFEHEMESAALHRLREIHLKFTDDVLRNIVVPVLPNRRSKGRAAAGDQPYPDSYWNGMTSRALNWVFTNYTKEHGTILASPDKHLPLVLCNSDYRSMLRCFSREKFDAFRRYPRKHRPYRALVIETSREYTLDLRNEERDDTLRTDVWFSVDGKSYRVELAQLNYLHHTLESDMAAYVRAHIQDIDRDYHEKTAKRQAERGGRKRPAKWRKTGGGRGGGKRRPLSVRPRVGAAVVAIPCVTDMEDDWKQWRDWGVYDGRIVRADGSLVQTEEEEEETKAAFDDVEFKTPETSLGFSGCVVTPTSLSTIRTNTLTMADTTPDASAPGAVATADASIPSAVATADASPPTPMDVEADATKEKDVATAPDDAAETKDEERRSKKVPPLVVGALSPKALRKKITALRNAVRSHIDDGTAIDFDAPVAVDDPETIGQFVAQYAVADHYRRREDDAPTFSVAKDTQHRYSVTTLKSRVITSGFTKKAYAEIRRQLADGSLVMHAPAVPSDDASDMTVGGFMLRRACGKILHSATGKLRKKPYDRGDE